ncbi:MAG: hypothetical protein K0U89_07555 [Planctomycetes bacterium]|nr:hypothetical protein [Planctomycetota bacterium]
MVLVLLDELAGGWLIRCGVYFNAIFDLIERLPSLYYHEMHERDEKDDGFAFNGGFAINRLKNALEKRGTHRCEWVVAE